MNKYNRQASKKFRYLVGIDEVGRGPLAGPVVVSALALPRHFTFHMSHFTLPPLRDSKRLSSKQREIWFEYLKKHPFISYATARVYPKLIDKINISQAANLAATKALKKLIANCNPPAGGANCKIKRAKQSLNPAILSRWQSHQGSSVQSGQFCNIYLDGGLYLDQKSLVASGYTLNTKTIIRGDEKIPAISLASIVAKVTRDRYMMKLHKLYPHYGFDKHKGYGTKAHIEAIRKHGLSPIHRLTFVKKYANVSLKKKIG